MITLTIISILYNIFALLRFKKLYGTYDILSKPPKGWTFALVISFAFAFAVVIFGIIKYLP